MKFIARAIEEQYQKPNERFKKLDVRLIGAQAISLARYSFRLVDQLQYQNEYKAEIIMRLALAKICSTLRDIGAEMNRVKIEDKGYCDKYRHFVRGISIYLHSSSKNHVKALYGQLVMLYHSMQGQCFNNLGVAMEFCLCREKKLSTPLLNKN